MDDLLSRLGVQAMNYAIRSGLALTSTYALSQCSRLLKTVDDQRLYDELHSLQTSLNTKVKILSPTLDLILLRSGRGNIFLESAVPLAKSLQKEIQSIGAQLEATARLHENESQHTYYHTETEPTHTPPYHTEKSGPQRNEETFRSILRSIQGLLDRIDREIPLLQLAITSSGETLSHHVPANISPSRLLQASTLLTVGDTHFAESLQPTQIGPSFSLSLYMIFAGHGRGHGQHNPHVDVQYGLGEDERKPIWKEVVHKARVSLIRRSPYSPQELPSLSMKRRSEYFYHLEIIEDLEDGRAHDDDEIENGGLRLVIPVHQVSKMFYTDTSRILNIGNEDAGNQPALLLKKDSHAQRHSVRQKQKQPPPDSGRTGTENSVVVPAGSEKQAYAQASGFLEECLPLSVDSEWMAFQKFDDEDSADEDSGSSDSDVEDIDNTLGGDVEDDEEDFPHVSALNLEDTPRKGMDGSLVSQLHSISSRFPLLSRLTSASSPDAAPGKAEPDLVTPTTHTRHSLTLASDRRLAAQSSDVSTAQSQDFIARTPFSAITTSLSLLEMLLRLASLQEFQQQSHLAIPDHMLTFFLEESSTTGLRGDAQWAARKEAKQKVGFDPYSD